MAIEHDVHRGILGKPDLNMRFPVILGAFVLALPFLTQRTPGAVWYLFGRAALVLLAPGLFARPMLLIVFLPFVFLALTTVLRRVVRGYALPAFAVLLAFLVLSNAVSTRRQILLARRNYRANPEFILLAKTAPEVLHPDARIATPSPALFHLFSGLQTVPPLPDSSMSHVTHKVTPRTDAPHEACILQERLMLCPA